MVGSSISAEAITGEEVCAFPNTALSSSIRTIKEWGRAAQLMAYQCLGSAGGAGTRQERIERMEGTNLNMQKLLGPDGKVRNELRDPVGSQACACACA